MRPCPAAAPSCTGKPIAGIRPHGWQCCRGALPCGARFRFPTGNARRGHGRKSVAVWASARSPRPPSPTPQVRAALFTGAYAVVFGIALTLFPKTAFGLLFNPEAVASCWIRVGGILFTLIGWQYLGTAWGDHQGQGARGFYRATVWSRLALSAAFGLLVACGEAPAGLLVLAALNMAGAVSMHLALRRSAGANGGSGSDSPSQPILKM